MFRGWKGICSESVRVIFTPRLDPHQVFGRDGRRRGRVGEPTLKRRLDLVPLGRLVLPRFSLQLEFLHQRFCDREKNRENSLVILWSCVRRNRGNVLLVSREEGGGRGVDRDADLGVEIRRGVNANDETER